VAFTNLRVANVDGERTSAIDALTCTGPPRTCRRPSLPTLSSTARRFVGARWYRAHWWVSLNSVLPGWLSGRHSQ